MKTYHLFVVPIGNTKITENIMFCLEAPVLKYHRKSSNSCCSSSLASAFHIISDNRAVTTLVNRIESSLTLLTDKFRNIIDFANDIMKSRICHKGEQRLRYNMKICN